MAANIVEMRDIIKNFGEVQAVKGGQFDLKAGEIHSLIGENGAGKSTMMKLLYGMYDAQGGEIWIAGERMDKASPKAAIEKGIGMVHQEFMLVPELTVLENIILGFEPRKGVTIDMGAARVMIQKYIDQYGMDVQMNKCISQISVGEAQRVEIIKILSRGANVLILDEPTAVLTPQEAQKLFLILENLKRSGKSIVFISHRLNEVMQISDRISVMRQGQYIGTIGREEATYAKLANMMIGREVFLNVDRRQAEVGPCVLEAKNLWVSGEKELSKIRDLSFAVHAGEIVGIAGIDGNGQSELIEAIAGLRRVEKGQVLLSGVDITNKSPKKIRQTGLAHIPEDRNLRGLNRVMSITDNLVAASLDGREICQHGIMKQGRMLAKAHELVKEFDIRPTDPTIRTSSLSGGNAQKVVVAREVSLGSKLLIASQPTRGVDIGAIEAIEGILQSVKAKGLGVLLVSADLREILSLSDRILVMYEGKIVGSLRVEEANENNLGLMMTGVPVEQAVEGAQTATGSKEGTAQ